GDAVALDRVRRERSRIALLEMIACLPPSPSPVVVDERRRDSRRDERCGIAARRLRVGADLAPTRDVLLGRDPDRQPAVSETPRASQRGRRASADPERRTTRLRRERLDRDALERRETSLEARRCGSEQRSERHHRLLRAFAPLRNRDADRLEVLQTLTADADSEHDPALREVVER